MRPGGDSQQRRDSVRRKPPGLAVVSSKARRLSTAAFRVSRAFHRSILDVWRWPARRSAALALSLSPFLADSLGCLGRTWPSCGQCVSGSAPASRPFGVAPLRALFKLAGVLCRRKRSLTFQLLCSAFFPSSRRASGDNGGDIGAGCCAAHHRHAQRWPTGIASGASAAHWPEMSSSTQHSH